MKKRWAHLICPAVVLATCPLSPSCPLAFASIPFPPVGVVFLQVCHRLCTGMWDHPCCVCLVSLCVVVVAEGWVVVGGERTLGDEERGGDDGK